MAGGHWGVTHWNPPPVLMQVLPLVQLSWDREHSSISGKQGWEAGSGPGSLQLSSPFHHKTGKTTLKWVKLWEHPGIPSPLPKLCPEPAWDKSSPLPAGRQLLFQTFFLIVWKHRPFLFTEHPWDTWQELECKGFAGSISEMLWNTGKSGRNGELGIFSKPQQSTLEGTKISWFSEGFQQF